MRTFPMSILVVAVLSQSAMLLADQPALTVYNQDFAVVRQALTLELQPGVNEVSFTETTAHLEPDSVILRDPGGQHRLQILEQNYRADPISQELLLSLFEGQTIDFLVPNVDEPVRGKIIRSSYVPHYEAWQRYGRQYQMTQMAMAYRGGSQGLPIIEVDGRLRFGLPGTPLFPNLSEETILKPTLHWLLETDATGPLPAELSYITGGMSWKADYNVVAPEEGDVLDLLAWVTIDNQSGRTFEDARIKLMAGDVSKLVPEWERQAGMYRSLGYMGSSYSFEPTVTERTFDEYHLYTLRRATTLRDHQTKQVEFERASGIKSERIYVYDGARIDHQRYQGWSLDSIRSNREYGTVSNPKVWVMREFANTKENNLGIPLPAGRVRFYRRDNDGQLEFTGENEIDHTPKDETVRVHTGSAFDLVGSRRRTDFSVNNNENWADESFEITLRNHKEGPVEIRVVEHLYRWHTWDVVEKSHEFTKTDAQTIEWRIQLNPDEEQKITYKVHYSW